MSRPTQMVCAWCGPAMTFLFFVGLMLLADFIPPPSPHDSAEQIAAMFRDNTDRIRVGVLLSMLGTGLLCPWYAVIAVQVKRIEGRWSPLAYTCLIAGACGVLEIVLPQMTWQAAAFRPERSPEVTQALNDLAWLPFLGLTTTVVLQNFVIGVAVLRDSRPAPIFPRWYGYLNFWIGLLVMPAGLIVFFKTGPFAWDGLLAWWVPVAAFFGWIVTTSVLLTQAIREQYRDPMTADG